VAGLPGEGDDEGNRERGDRDGLRGDREPDACTTVGLHALRHRGHALSQLRDPVVSSVAVDHALGQERGDLRQRLGRLVPRVALTQRADKRSEDENEDGAAKRRMRPWTAPPTTAAGLPERLRW
jgi:hypothetical protein